MSRPMERFPFHLLRKQGDSVHLRVRRGEVIITFTRDEQPEVVPVEDGNYEVDFEPLENARFPIGVQIVPARLAALICKLAAAEVNKTLDTVLLAEARHTGRAS